MQLSLGTAILDQNQAVHLNFGLFWGLGVGGALRTCRASGGDWCRRGDVGPAGCAAGLRLGTVAGRGPWNKSPWCPAPWGPEKRDREPASPCIVWVTQNPPDAESARWASQCARPTCLCRCGGLVFFPHLVTRVPGLELRCSRPCSLAQRRSQSHFRTGRGACLASPSRRWELS